MYQSVNVTSIFDENVTADGISSAFNSLASKVSADDVFIFYLSGHGTTHTDGDYYFIPVDFRFRNAQSVPESAISKHFITENLYTCTNDILYGLGTGYVGGGEMTENIEKMGGEGTAEFIFKAIKIYCGK